MKNDDRDMVGKDLLIEMDEKIQAIKRSIPGVKGDIGGDSGC
jgi:hypothetical protein